MLAASVLPVAFVMQAKVVDGIPQLPPAPRAHELVKGAVVGALVLKDVPTKVAPVTAEHDPCSGEVQIWKLMDLVDPDSEAGVVQVNV